MRQGIPQHCNTAWPERGACARKVLDAIKAEGAVVVSQVAPCN